MADFSLTTLFVVPVGQSSFPSSGSTQNLTAGQVGIFGNDYTATNTPGNFPYFYVAQGRVNTYLQGSKRSDKIAGCQTGANCRGGRIIAIGTTAVRALESASQGGRLEAGCGDTDLFITPGYRFNTIDALLTNFHLPESTLLMLVAAFAGYEPIMKAYRHAIEQRYRFFSYGDAMFLDRH